MHKPINEIKLKLRDLQVHGLSRENYKRIYSSVKKIKKDFTRSKSTPINKYVDLKQIKIPILSISNPELKEVNRYMRNCCESFEQICNIYLRNILF